MKFLDIIFLAYKDISGRKLRSWLTILGIVIGIASVVGLVGASQSMVEQIENELGKLDADKIMVVSGSMGFSFMMPSSGATERLNPLTEDDVDAVSKIPSIIDATGIVSKNMPVEYNGQVFVFSVDGIQPSNWDTFHSTDVVKGRKLKDSDRYSALIGYSIAYELFDDDLNVKKRITINNQTFTVVGILEKVGGLMQQEDTSIVINKDIFRELFLMDNEDISTLLAKKKADESSKFVGEEVETVLIRNRNIKEADFTVITADFMQQIVGNIMVMVNAMMGAIASISLVVGGIGIANTMYTTIHEKTREIGIMKAIGAKSKDILSLFVVESGVMGLIGGLVGVLFGYLLGKGFLVMRAFVSEKVMPDMGNLPMAEASLSTNMNVSPQIIIFSLIFSFLIGIIFGYFPSKKASKLEPINALRYE